MSKSLRTPSRVAASVDDTARSINQAVTTTVPASRHEPAGKAKPLAPLTEAWQALYVLFSLSTTAREKGLKKKLRIARNRLHPLLADLSLRQIDPGVAVSNEVHDSICRFTAATSTGGKDLTKTISRLIWAWNTAQAEIPGWPQISLENPNKRSLAAPPLSALSYSLQRDIDDYRRSGGIETAPTLPATATPLERLRAQPRRFASRKSRRRLSQASLRNHTYVLRRTAEVVARTRVLGLQTIKSIAEVATIEGAAALVDSLLNGSAPETNTCSGLVWMLRSIAVRWRGDLTREEYDDFGFLAANLAVYRPKRMTSRVGSALRQAVIAAIKATGYAGDREVPGQQPGPRCADRPLLPRSRRRRP